VPEGPAREIVAHPAFGAICARLATRAQAGFARGRAEIGQFPAQAMLPAAVMAWGYGRLMDRLVARGFERRGARPRLTKGEKLSMALMALGLRKP
jgi:phytoene/squalene synthetase